MATIERRIDQLTALPEPLQLTDDIPVHRGGRTYRAPASVVQATVAPPLPFYTSTGLGIPVDSATDATPLTNAAIETLTAAGGGHIIFRSVDGLMPYFKGTVINRTNVKLDFSYVPSVLLGPYGNLRNEGGYTESSVVITLGANIAAGVSTFIAVPISGAITSYLSVGDKIILRGNRDSGGAALWYQEMTVLTLDGASGTVTTVETTSYAFTTTYPTSAYAAAGNDDETTISRRVSTLLTADATIDSKTFAVTSADGFQVGQIVELRDEKQCDDIAGASTALINTEHFVITGISSLNITVDRRARRLFDTAHAARLWLKDPCVNASIIGANIVFTEPPPASPRIDTLINWHAYRSTIERCKVLNTESDATIGSRGQMFCNRYSFRCGIYDCIGERPKYTAGGEGNALTHFHSTECTASGIEAAGCRHASYMEASTSCYAHFSSIKDGVSVAVDFHGCLETDCHVVVDQAEAGKVGGNSTDFVAFGHSENFAGTKDCTASCGDGEYFDIAAVFEPGADGCEFSGSFANIRIGAQIFNRTAANPVVVTRPSLRDLELTNVSEYIVNADGQEDGDGGIDRPIVDLRLNGVIARNVIKGFRIHWVDGCIIMDSEVDGHAVDAGDTYLMRVENTLGLTVTNNTFSTIGRFLQIANCPAFYIADNVLNRLANAAYTNVLAETGTSTGFMFFNNTALGFTPDESHVTTPGRLWLTISGT